MTQTKLEITMHLFWGTFSVYVLNGPQNWERSLGPFKLHQHLESIFGTISVHC